MKNILFLIVGIIVFPFLGWVFLWERFIFNSLLAAELAISELQNKVTEQAGSILIYRDMLLDYDSRIKALESIIAQ